MYQELGHVTVTVMVLHTPFSKAFGLDVPVVGAPMAGVSGPELTASVARAGGLGLLGAAVYKDGDELRRCRDRYSNLGLTNLCHH